MSGVGDDKLGFLQTAVLQHFPVDSHNLIAGLELPLAFAVRLIDEDSLVRLSEADTEGHVL